MLADLPFKISFGVAVAASLARSIDRHRGLGMIGINRAVAGFASDAGCLPGLRIRIVTGGMAAHTSGRTALGFPIGQESRIRRGLSMRAMLPGILIFSMAHHAIGQGGLPSRRRNDRAG